MPRRFRPGTSVGLSDGGLLIVRLFAGPTLEANSNSTRLRCAHGVAPVRPTGPAWSKFVAAPYSHQRVTLIGPFIVVGSNIRTERQSDAPQGLLQSSIGDRDRTQVAFDSRSIPPRR